MLKRSLLLATLCASAVWADAEEPLARPFKLTPISKLEQQAREREHQTARVPLLETNAPNYVRALALTPNAAEGMSKMMRAVLDKGALDTNVKAAMGLRIAQLLDSPYVAAQTESVLNRSGHGKHMLSALRDEKLDELTPDEKVAVQYAEWLTEDVHGVSDADFREVRTHYNDSQLVELTTTTCFFNYLTRFTNALNLPVDAETGLNEPSEVQVPIARVALISDEEIDALTRAQQQTQQVKSALGLRFANSMRAMYLSPAVATAWFEFGQSSRSYDRVSREIKLQISFAVSMANNCRYCTLHQVLGLKRLDVSPAKLMQMKKDDSALTPDELAAVKFARKLTAEPWAITDADYATLVDHFGKQGALEVVMQTCNFAYMNHFTDGLRLPSEDEAVKTYREVYGSDFKRTTETAHLIY